ncbi:MAG: Crp/Fnr family transcriptional regulator [Xanthobacteraceae bacterium]|nr:Crp/Fnr family transcriptional regulator [Xanthobacteraceae bacterium]
MIKSEQPSFDMKTFFARTGEGRSIRKFEKSDIIFSQGDPADAVFYVQTGRVKLTVTSEQGKEAVVGILEAGEFLGEGCLSGETVRLATSISFGDSVITSITKTAMRAALKNTPQFSELFLKSILTRKARVEQDLIDQLFNSSEKRLARLLLLLAHFGKDGSPEPVDIEINQETLAEMIGTTRSRVSFFMNKFRKQGFISYNGKIHVHKSLLNNLLHEVPALRIDDSRDHGSST